MKIQVMMMTQMKLVTLTKIELERFTEKISMNKDKGLRLTNPKKEIIETEKTKSTTEYKR